MPYSSRIQLVCVAILTALIAMGSCLIQAQSHNRQSTGFELRTASLTETFKISTRALKINVADMETAIQFYVDKLGFEIEDRSDYPRQVALKTEDRVKLLLSKVKRLQSVGPKDSHVGLTLQVNDLEKTILRMKSAGVQFGETESRKEAVGNAISIVDPFGHRISLMHQTVVNVPAFKEPRIYNFGVLVPDMNAGQSFYVNKLGFIALTQKYLPLDLPLGHQDRTFGFMLHYREGVQVLRRPDAKASPGYSIVFETEDLPAAVEAMKRNGIEIIENHPARKAQPATVVFSDSFGNVLELQPRM